ncbi:MAG: 4-(cytidine 5'-diphospho)-2-C-methyl-D-erythritol kinase [Candidatus Aminicenantes bacterium]|nr:MAG: 4-(cytidine 5'-diphospho)-2-C-methyl-D-erythritol kinase [Candidatus Aminicenantes bacterium]
MMRIKSFAKINLGLEVVSRREDNYHEIRTLFQTIDFYDVIQFLPTSSNKIVLKGDDKRVPWDKENLIFKAAALLKEKFRIPSGVEIRTVKKIPPGKGLGGGSSNAAMTLFSMNKIWELHLEREELMEMGKTLGADVPFFLEGGLCLGLGRGDQIIPLPDLDLIPCILALPSFSILTAHVYNQFRLSLTSEDKDSKIIKFLADRKFDLLENRLEETIFSLYPQLKVIWSLLRRQGSELSLVSGTGSAVFGLFRDRGKAKKCLVALKKRCPSLLVNTLSREQYQRGINDGV